MTKFDEHTPQKDRAAEAPSRTQQAAQRTKADESEADYLVDETGAHIGVPTGKVAARAHANEDTIGATGPTNWWRTGIILLAVLVVLLIILQMVTSGGVAA